MFDVGITYEKHRRLYLAVSRRLLIGVIKKKGLVEVRLEEAAGFFENRRVTVEQLRLSWGIGRELFDEVAGTYMKLSTKGVSLDRIINLFLRKQDLDDTLE